MMQTTDHKGAGCVVCGKTGTYIYRWPDLQAVVCYEHMKWSREQVRSIIEQRILENE
jgi:hypothetical protein